MPLRSGVPHDLGFTVFPTLLKRFTTTRTNIRVDLRLDSSTAIQDIFISGDVNAALITEQHSILSTATELYAEEFC